jgi:hypothetical protein
LRGLFLTRPRQAGTGINLLLTLDEPSNSLFFPRLTFLE